MPENPRDSEAIRAGIERAFVPGRLLLPRRRGGPAEELD
jgi:hypothetical protein